MHSVEKDHSAKVHFWNDPTVRAIFYQIITLTVVGLIGYYLFSNTLANLERQSIATGFGFLAKESSFEIGESLIPYSSANTYARALLVGFLNTLKVAFVGIILTVILGAFIGIARLSRNWLVSKIAAIYIEVFQNIPILLQLIFFYAIFYEIFPSPSQAYNPIAGVFLTNRGIDFAVPVYHVAHKYMLIAFLVVCVASYIIKRQGQVMNLIILPQALRVIVPPLTSQMLNLTKNSSLAVAIGFPDFVAVANTSINQTGQAIEGVALIMLCYLTFSLLTSAFMNWYNKRIALVER